MPSTTRASRGSWSRVTAGPTPAMTPSIANSPPRVSVSRSGSTRRAFRKAIGGADIERRLVSAAGDCKRFTSFGGSPPLRGGGKGAAATLPRLRPLAGEGDHAKRGGGVVGARSAALHLDLLRRLLSLGGLRHLHGEHAMLEARLDLIRVHRLGDSERALERAEPTFPQVEVLLLLFLVFRLLALDCQHAVGDLEFDVLLVEAGQIGGHPKRVVVLDEIDRRHRDPGLGRPEGLDVERRPSERRAERKTRVEVLEQPVDLVAKILERTQHPHG